MTATMTRPAHLWVPDHDTTAGGEAADLAASVGLDLFDEQRLALDAILAERAGQWAAFEVAIVTGRQNLKTFVFEIAALHDAFLRRVGRVVWTAHLYKTTAESFANLSALVENYDHLRRRVYKVYSASNEQRIKLLPRHSGPTIDFMARKGGASGRGLAGDTVMFDEALFLSSMTLGGLIPTLSTRPDPQVRYGSSAGLVESAVLRTLRDRGRAGGDPSLAYIEWASRPGACADPQCRHAVGTEGCLLDDEDRWVDANPALGKRISLEYVRKERRSLDPGEFARERLGWWDDPEVVGTDIALEPWQALADPAAQPRDPVVFAFDVSPGFASASVVACGSGADGRPVVEVVEHAPGTSWLVARLAGLQQAHGAGSVAFDPSGPAGSLQPELAAAGVAVDVVSSQRMTQACGAFIAAVTDGQLVHRGERALTDAAVAGRRRTSGDAARWSRRDSTVDICPLVAATIARHVWAERADGQSYDLDDSIY